jgi:hypothetical protein
MSAIKPIIREVKQAVLKGFAHSKDKLHQLTDNVGDHLDNVVKQVRDKDNFDGPELTGSSTTRVNRTDSDPLYRSDNRPPATIFSEGFQVRDATNNDLDTFVRTNGPSNFVSTTRDPDLYQRWGSDYRYTVDSPGGIDVDKTMPDGPYAPHKPNPEHEVAFQGGISAEHVAGAHPVLPGGNLGDWIPNPNYSGGGR